MVRSRQLQLQSEHQSGAKEKERAPRWDGLALPLSGIVAVVSLEGFQHALPPVLHHGAYFDWL